MKRTDLAAPSVIDPAAFKWVGGTYFGSNPNEDYAELLGEWMGEKDEDGKAGWYSKKPEVLKEFPPLNATGNFARKGTCDHCGARFDWGSIYQHTSGGHIVVGNVCADKTMDVPSRLELDVKRMKSKLQAARAAARTAALAREAAQIAGYEWLYNGPHGNKLLDDIAAKGLKYGMLTARQVDLVRRIHDGTPAEWQVKKAARDAQRAAEEAAAIPVPVTDERVKVVGTILTTKTEDSIYGLVTKMLVRADEGYKLWGTVPRELLSGVTLIGAKVSFAAKIQRSDKDEKFGFFSRPTKAARVAVAS